MSGYIQNARQKFNMAIVGSFTGRATFTEREIWTVPVSITLYFHHQKFIRFSSVEF
jgi:hypothetical protein